MVPVLGWYELSFPLVAVYLLTLFMVGFKKKLFIYFNWRIITLQNCDGFCHTSVWIGHRYTCVLNTLSISLLLGRWGQPVPRLSQRFGFGCPASYIKLSLVIYFTYSKVYVPVLFSQIIPPSPSPTESRSLFITSVLLCRIKKFLESILQIIYLHFLILQPIYTGFPNSPLWPHLWPHILSLISFLLFLEYRPDPFLSQGLCTHCSFLFLEYSPSI